MNKKVEENLDTEAVNVKDHRDELIKLRLVSNTRILHVIGDQTALINDDILWGRENRNVKRALKKRDVRNGIMRNLLQDSLVPSQLFKNLETWLFPATDAD